MRISKYFSQEKILSRREAEDYIRQGKISVNGEIVTDLGRQIDPKIDKIEIVGEKEEKTTVLFYKPRGVETSEIFNLVPKFRHLNTVGRLDKESEGLILLSNDGVVTNLVTGKEHVVEKEYLVETKEKVTQTQINAMSKVMNLSDGPTLPAKAEIVSDHSFKIILKEGRNHQVRRMANQVRLTVNKLTRIRIGNLTVDDLLPGQYKKVHF